MQYQLLKLGIDSARLTTDAGIDLIVYVPGTGAAMTLQVKTVERAAPAGGRGRLAIGWNFPHDTPAQVLAFTYMQDDTVWLFTAADARRVAQQHTSSERSSACSSATSPDRSTDNSPPQ